MPQGRTLIEKEEEEEEEEEEVEGVVRQFELIHFLLRFISTCVSRSDFLVTLYFKGSLFLCIYLINYSVITYVTVCNNMYLHCKYIVYFGVLTGPCYTCNKKCQSGLSLCTLIAPN